MKQSIILLLLFLSSSQTLSQKVSLGVKLESFGYFIQNTVQNTSELSIIPVPLSGYVKASISLYDKYEVEIKGGVQLGEIFAGPEYALAVKYNLWENILPLITYLKHFNAGDSRTFGGIYNNEIEFIGIGMEAKLTKLFGLDLIFYIPIGEKGLEYSLDFYSTDIRKVTTSRMGTMLKLGFVFNIHL